MASYVFYDSRARQKKLRLVKHRNYSSAGLPTAEKIFAEFVGQYPRLIVVEENKHRERIVMRGPESQ
jgi:hypothetical protein